MAKFQMTPYEYFFNSPSYPTHQYQSSYPPPPQPIY